MHGTHTAQQPTPRCNPHPHPHKPPQSLRDQLEGLGVRTGRSAIHHSVSSPCGTRKLLLQLEEGRLIEAVGIPVDRDGAKRLTVCVSSQVRGRERERGFKCDA
jgi:adenine C2-methylase RlmN of 23S rRNA A2503 and tRNA A37